MLVIFKSSFYLHAYIPYKVRLEQRMLNDFLSLKQLLEMYYKARLNTICFIGFGTIFSNEQ